MKSNLTEKWIVCRICLEKPKEDMQTIFNQNAEKDLTRMILECGGVPIKKFDHYPDKICMKCLKWLHVAHRFRTTCQRSYKHLSRFIAPVEVDQQGEIDTNSVTDFQEIDDFDTQHGMLAEINEDNATHSRKVKIEPHDVKPEAQDEEELFAAAEAAAAASGTGDEEYYDYESYVGIEEVNEMQLHADDIEQDRAPSEISAEIEFLDEIEDEVPPVIPITELQDDYDIIEEPYTSDEDFVPSSKRTSQQRRRGPTTRKITTNANIVAKRFSSRIGKLPVTEGQMNAVLANDEDVNCTTNATRVRGGRGRVKGKDKDKQQKYICDVCGNMYHSQGRLTEHIKLHSGIKPHECEICGHCFAQAQQLARHMNTHTGNRPFKCNYCTAAFADLSTRNKHHRIHTNERPYICDVCGKSFSYTNTLKFHKMIHTGEKPHVCDICGKGFNQAYKLRNHKKTHEKRGLTSTGIKMEMDNITILHNIDAVTTGTIMEM